MAAVPCVLNIYVPAWALRAASWHADEDNAVFAMLYYQQPHAHGGYNAVLAQIPAAAEAAAAERRAPTEVAAVFGILFGLAHNGN